MRQRLETWYDSFFGTVPRTVVWLVIALAGACLWIGVALLLRAVVNADIDWRAFVPGD